MNKARIRRSELVRKRIGRGLTLDELGKEAGLSGSTIANLESGRTKGVHPSTIRKLADAFNCEPDDLFDLEEVPA